MSADDGSPGFGVYIHWPFCAAKCPYCDFNSHVRHTPVDQADFAKAYVLEIGHMASLTGPREVTSIFFGGGTPSLMDASTMATIMEAIARHWGVREGAEITLEANPASSDASRFRDYRRLGVNRVSLGVQALNDNDLKFLGRLHTVEEALQAVKLARELFPAISFDLIYARPGQTLKAWEAELREAISHAVDHLSLYQLTIEEGTPFKALHDAGKIATPGDDLGADLYELTQDVTAELGLPAYEVSNHARPGAHSRHNLTYWRYGDYAGIGPGAHGRLTLTDGSKLATQTERHPETWASAVSQCGHGMTEASPLSADQQADEMLLMGLRLSEGFDLARHETLGGHMDDGRLQAMIDLGMIQRKDNTRIKATAKGRMVLNSLVAELAA